LGGPFGGVARSVVDYVMHSSKQPTRTARATSNINLILLKLFSETSSIYFIISGKKYVCILRYGSLLPV